MVVQGGCDPRFEQVRDEFERNFTERGEVGAAVCVMVDGEPVVDLWGGIADPSESKPWDRDTLVVIMSASKGAAALCGNMLVDRGQLDLEAPVAHYWPEFARKGKADIPVRMAFNHQSGVAHVSGWVPDGGLADWGLMIRFIEETRPFWRPGTRVGYHALTQGYLIGELVRRISGKRIGVFFRDEVAGPLGLDFWIGLPEDQEYRVAKTIRFDHASEEMPAPMRVVARMPPRLLYTAASAVAPGNLGLRMLTNLGGWAENLDARKYHDAEIPAGGAIANARSLAGMYAPLSLGGVIGKTRLVNGPAIAGMRYSQSVSDCDAVTAIRTCYTLGFSKSWPNRHLGVLNNVIIGEDAFGTPGAGGHIGFADPSCRLAFGYTMNRHGPGAGLNSRGQSLVDAVYRILGSPTDKPGFWVRPPGTGL